MLERPAHNPAAASTRLSALYENFAAYAANEAANPTHSPATTGSAVRAAKDLARLGLRVFPVRHRLPDGACSCGKVSHRPDGSEAASIGKHPVTRHGHNDGSRSNAQIDAWFWGHPLANLAVVTGEVIDVIDVDNPDALQDVLDLIAAGRFPQPLATVRTGRDGGMHLWIPATGAPSKSKILDGVDYRGSGGYVVAPPSIHRTGVSYRWSMPEFEPGDPRRGKDIAAALASTRWSDWNTRGSGRKGQKRGGKAVGQESLSRQVAKISRETPGNRYEACLAAGDNLGCMVRAGWLTAAEVIDALLGAYRYAGGRDERSARRAIENALRHGEKRALPLLSEAREPISASTAGEYINVVRTHLACMLAQAEIPDAHVFTARRTMIGILDRCSENSPRTQVKVPLRDIQEWAGVGSPSTAKKILGWLTEGQLLEVVKPGSRPKGEAATIRVLGPPGTAGVPGECLCETGECATSEATDQPESLPAEGHHIWSMRRGQGRGLTSQDHDLLKHLPTALGASIRISDWAQAAGVARETASRNAHGRAESVTLASLGLVLAGRGVVRATLRGAVVAEAVQGHATLEALDWLAEQLKVGEGAERLARRIADERALNEMTLLPFIVEQVLRGHAAGERWLVLVRRQMHVGCEALTPLLRALDQTADPQSVRPAVARVVIDAAAGRSMSAVDQEKVLTWANTAAYFEDGSSGYRPSPMTLLAQLAADLHDSQRPCLQRVDLQTGELTYVDDPDRAVDLAHPIVQMEGLLTSMTDGDADESLAARAATQVVAFQKPFRTEVAGYVPVVGPTDMAA